jgi:hypothetical protein
VLISRHPLLIQKTMADKLSDKITVIIAPPSTSGGFIGAGLLGAAGKADKTEVSANTRGSDDAAGQGNDSNTEAAQ